MGDFIRSASLSLCFLAFTPVGAFAGKPAPAPAPPSYVQHVESGTIKATCSPWKTISFKVDLKNTHSTVYSSLDAVEKHGGAVVFETNAAEAKEGMAQIIKCDRDGKNCKSKEGIVAITTIEPDVVIGVVQINLAGWGRNYNGNESHMFRAKYDRTKPVCE